VVLFGILQLQFCKEPVGIISILNKMLVLFSAIQQALSPFLVPNMKLDRFIFMQMRVQFFSFCIELKYLCIHFTQLTHLCSVMKR